MDFSEIYAYKIIESLIWFAKDYTYICLHRLVFSINCWVLRFMSYFNTGENEKAWTEWETPAHKKFVLIQNCMYIIVNRFLFENNLPT